MPPVIPVSIRKPLCLKLNTRIGGWLLAPMAYLIVTLLSASLMLLLYAMAIFMPESRDYLLTNAQAFTLQWYFSVLTTLLMWCFTLWLLWLFCQRSQRFPAVLAVAADHGAPGGESLRLRAGAG